MLGLNFLSTAPSKSISKTTTHRKAPYFVGALAVQYLVVAGGGGGSRGGGGAGGYRTDTLFLTSDAYTVTVGGGELLLQTHQ